MRKAAEFWSSLRPSYATAYALAVEGFTGDADAAGRKLAKLTDVLDAQAVAGLGSHFAG